MSSVLVHYSAAYSHRATPSARVALVLSHWLRRMGKLLAIVNSVRVVLACIFQYSNFYDTCFCLSNVLGRGKPTYAANIETAAQAHYLLLKAAWGAFVLASTSALVFLGIGNLLLYSLPLQV
jgi:hypothetical protein